MAKQDDIARAREAARALELAVADLGRHYPEAVDVHRLRTDASRIGDDLDLLCGRESVPPAPPEAPRRQVIPDTPYAHDFWMDAEDEGLGRAR